MANTEQRKIQIIADGKSASASIKDMQRAVRLLGRELDGISTKDPAFSKKSAEFQQLNNRLRTTRAEARGVRRGIGGLTAALGPMGIALTALSVLKDVARWLGDSSKVAAEFEASLSNLSAITGASGADLAAYADAAKEIGSSTTLSATQAVEAFKLIGSAKPELLGSRDALVAVTNEAVTLAEAAGIQLPEAAGALTKIMNQFGLGATEASRTINVLAAGSKAGAGDINFLSDAIGRFGPAAAAANISIEESGAAMEVLAEAGIASEAAGTQFRNILIKLAGSANDDFNPAIVGIQQAMENLGAANMDTAELTRMFGSQNLLAAQTLVNSTDALASYTDAMTDTNVAYEQQAINVDNLKGDVAGFQSAMEELQITVGTGTNRAFRPLVQLGTRIVRFFTDLTKRLGPIRELFHTMGEQFRSTWHILRQLIQGADGAGNKFDFVGFVAGKLTKIVETLVQGLSGLARVAQIVSNRFAGVYNNSETLRRIFGGLKGVIGTLVDAFGGLIDAAGALTNWDFDAVREGLERTGESFSSMGDTIREAADLEAANQLTIRQMQEMADDSESIAAEHNTEMAAIEAQAQQEAQAARRQAQQDALREQETFEEQRRQQAEAAAAARRQLAEAEAQMELDIQQLTIDAMAEGTAKRLAQAELDHAQELAQLQQHHEELLASEHLTAEGIQRIQAAQGLKTELLAQQHQANVQAIREQGRADSLAERDAGLAEEQAMEEAHMERQFLQVLHSQSEINMARLDQQRIHAEQRLLLLQETGRGETIEAEKLRNTIMAFEVQMADAQIAELLRVQEARTEMQRQAQGLINEGLDFVIQAMSTEHNARGNQLAADKNLLQKKLAVLEATDRGEGNSAELLRRQLSDIDVQEKQMEVEALERKRAAADKIKKFQIAQVIINGLAEISSIWRAAQAGPQNIATGGLYAPIFAGAQSALSIARNVTQIRKIRAQAFADGGYTKQLPGLNYRMADNTPLSNIGSFARGGYVSQPSIGVVAEAGPELVLPNRLLRHPAYANTAAWLGRVVQTRAYESGGFTGPSPSANTGAAGAGQEAGMAAVHELRALRDEMSELRDTVAEWPKVLEVVNDPLATLRAAKNQLQVENDGRLTRRGAG